VAYATGLGYFDVPTDNVANAIESGEAAGKSESVTFQRMEDGYAVFDVGSGAYSFRVP
jgi:hypothetical protein